jgi:transcriptional regulator with XRE-family HTH domain
MNPASLDDPAPRDPRAPAESGPPVRLPSLGQRLREGRDRRGLSLRALAGRAGVSASLISQIERGLVTPSVGTLWSLATELGLTIDGLFSEAARAADPPAPSTAPGSPVQRAADRKRIRLAGGVQWERLTAEPDDEVQFLHVIYEVGAESCPADSLFRHGGKEYAFVVSGQLGLQIGFDAYELAAGDSVSFSADMPHRLWAIGDTPAVAIWAVIRRANDRRVGSGA